VANRWDYYYRLKVLEDELDQADAALEAADQAIVYDLGLGKDEDNPAEYGGVCWGFDATNPSGLGILIDSGAAYDSSGRRCYTDQNCTVTVSHAGDVAIGGGGIPTGADTDPASGFERWASIFIVYDRLLTDPRYDGYNTEVYFNRAESFHFSVAVGTEKANGTLSTSDKPARETGKILLADVRIRNTGGTIAVYSFDQDREELFFRVTASGATPDYPNGTVIARAQLREVLDDLLEFYNDHVGGRRDRHPATEITYAGGTTWADGTGGALGSATDVDGAIRGANTDLKSTAEVAGAKRIGAKAQTGALATPAMAALSFSGGTLEAQITALLVAVNGRVFRGGDSGITGALTPASDGVDLGTDTFSWNAFLKDLKVKGVVGTNLVPSTTGLALGSEASRWGFAYIDYLTVYNMITLGAATLLQSAGQSNLHHVSVDGNLVTSGTTLMRGAEVNAWHGANGLDLVSSGQEHHNGKLLRVRPNYCSATGNMYTIDKFGLIDAGVLFHDNFAYVSDLAGHTGLDDVLPKQRWSSVCSYASYSYGIKGNSATRAFVAGPDGAGQLGPDSCSITAGMQWKMGVGAGLVGRFTCGFAIPYGNSGAPWPNSQERLRFGFFGTAQPQACAYITITPAGTYATLSSGTEAIPGAVNLWTPSDYNYETFRIIQYTTDSFYFEGPSGSETINTPNPMPADTVAVATIVFATQAGPCSGCGFGIHEICVNEVNTLDLP